MIIDIIFWLFIVFVAGQAIGSILYFKYGIGKRWFHDIMGWCIPDKKYYYDGVNLHSRCRYCHKNIIQDSQGNWFPAEH